MPIEIYIDVNEIEEELEDRFFKDKGIEDLDKLYAFAGKVKKYFANEKKLKKLYPPDLMEYSNCIWTIHNNAHMLQYEIDYYKRSESNRAREDVIYYVERVYGWLPLYNKDTKDKEGLKLMREFKKVYKKPKRKPGYRW